MQKLIEKYNYPVPRYTSYPPANFFWQITIDDFTESIKSSNKKENLISFYIHIPFCKKMCFYCGCNMTLVNKDSQIERYFEALHKEIKNILPLIDKNRKLSQIHYGWGTPNSVDIKYLKEINDIFLSHFETIEKPEIAIEAHPAFLDEKSIWEIVDAWFNRISIWIQDFDENVLKNVNRDPSKLEIEELIKLLRNKKEDISINLDFIYGLPWQTIESFTETIEKAVKIKPDRLVTFSYAHVPDIKKTQKVLELQWLPDTQTKSKMFELAKDILLKSWYKNIGLDHFVLEKDTLYKAISTNNLARNFQWYCTKETTWQVYAFGSSAISQLDNAYIQNKKDIEKYIKMINETWFANDKWVVFNENIKIIAKAIEQIMCNYSLDLGELAKKQRRTVEEIKDICKINDETFIEMINDNLLDFRNNKIEVSEIWKMFIRNIASKLDPEFKTTKKTFSKWI